MLDHAATAAKRRMLDKFVTQGHVLALFETGTERFRAAMPCDFARPPEAGEFLYARFDWGLDPNDWPALVRSASLELDLPQCL